VEELRQRILELAPSQWEPPFLSDLLHPEDLVVLVTPIDTGAPRGRLIMPQVKALRDTLDAGAMPLCCRESELQSALHSLRRKPALVVTDSQAFALVAGIVPDEILLTSFSILSARQKGDLPSLVEGVLAVPSLRPGDKVLIAESCSHHPLKDDIGRVKIPHWLQDHAGGGLRIDTAPGSRYPDDLSSYRLVVHCGACTLNRREMLRRQELPAGAGVAMTNYGVLISFLKNVFPRALRPFPELYTRYEKRSWPGR
jgi:[FeFe] hydrogenase H-cluster maturation GTPase HydF